MAVTKISSIKSKELAKLRYIADPEKTDGGRLIRTFYCSDDPKEAIQDFRDFRDLGTGMSTVLSQHFIQSFMPGEITPEMALELGEELCRRFLKGHYQYFLAVHTDKDHIHVHVIFNNTNMDNYRTFETLENRRSDPSYKKLMKFSDEICREHHLSVIEEQTQIYGGNENED